LPLARLASRTRVRPPAHQYELFSKRCGPNAQLNVFKTRLLRKMNPLESGQFEPHRQTNADPPSEAPAVPGFPTRANQHRREWPSRFAVVQPAQIEDAAFHEQVTARRPIHQRS